MAGSIPDASGDTNESRMKLVDTLQTYCASKAGATKKLWPDSFGIADSEFSEFAVFTVDKARHFLRVRCTDELRKSLTRAKLPIKASKRHVVEIEGWKWTIVRLDESVPIPTLQELIDESYAISFEARHEFVQRQVELFVRAKAGADFVAELIEGHGLTRQRKQIEGFAVPSLLLKATAASGQKFRLGESKIGGQPDLPEGVDWPTFTDGKPLVFLAQINLEELPATAQLSLPRNGLLSIFSVFGWQEDGDSDPQLPPGVQNANWTRVLHVSSTNLSRCRTFPSTFPPSRVEFIPTVCYPRDDREPTLARLKWNREIQERYNDFVGDYLGVTKLLNGLSERTLLLGYADYEQDFTPEVGERRLRLLFQLGSVGSSEMMWGDGGYLYFWIPPADLARGHFQNIWADCQGG